MSPTIALYYLSKEINLTLHHLHPTVKMRRLFSPCKQDEVNILSVLPLAPVKTPSGKCFLKER